MQKMIAEGRKPVQASFILHKENRETRPKRPCLQVIKIQISKNRKSEDLMVPGQERLLDDPSKFAVALEMIFVCGETRNSDSRNTTFSSA